MTRAAGRRLQMAIDNMIANNGKPPSTAHWIQSLWA